MLNTVQSSRGAKRRAFGVAAAAIAALAVGVIPQAAQADGSFTVDVEVVGNGHVTSDVPGIECSSQLHTDCSYAFDDTTVVTLTAKADAGMTFVNWTGAASCDLSTSATCVLTVTEALSVAANFEAKDTFVPLESPIRLLDTRPGQLGLLERLDSIDLDLVLQPGQVYTKPWSAGGEPGTVDVLNVTAVAPTGPGYVRIYGCNTDDPTPATSLLNYNAGTTVQNLGTVSISAESKVCFQSSRATRLVIDMTGYFPAGMTTFQAPAAPVRLVDTRVGERGVLEGVTDEDTPFAAGIVRKYVPGGFGDLPASGVKAVVLNLVAIMPGESGILQVYPCSKVTDAAPKNITTVSYAAGTTTAGGGVVVLHKDAKAFCVKSSAATNVLVDMTGWHLTTGSGFKSFGADGKPKSLYDTRVGTKGELEGRTDETAPLEAGVVRRLVLASKAGFPNAASLGSVALTVTAFDATVNGYVTVWPCESVDSPAPTTANLNVRAGASSSNAAIVGVADDGGICMVANQTLNVDIDAQGWYVR